MSRDPGDPSWLPSPYRRERPGRRGQLIPPRCGPTGSEGARLKVFEHIPRTCQSKFLANAHVESGQLLSQALVGFMIWVLLGPGIDARLGLLPHRIGMPEYETRCLLVLPVVEEYPEPLTTNAGILERSSDG